MAKNDKQLSNVQEVRSKNNPQLTLQQEQRLYELHEEKNRGAFDEYKSYKHVVVFGQPGCGRSTVINSLLGRKLETFKDRNNQLLVNVVNPELEPQLQISHYSPGQETLTPIQDKDITIWECTGLYKQLGGTKGIEYIVPKDEKMKMRESPRIMQLLKTVNSVRFILVAHYNDLTVQSGRGDEFIATVDRIASIFSDLDLIKESILLVITKAPSLEKKEGIVQMIEGAIKRRDMSEHTKKLMEYLTKSPVHIFYKPEKEGKVEGPTLELIQILPSCDVSQSIQYPALSPLNQERALKVLEKYDARVQDEEAKKQLAQAEIDTTNISNAGVFIKVVDFIYATLSGISILSKAGHYAGEILMAFGSLIGINNFKGYASSNTTEIVSEEDYSPQPMSPGKIKLAKCLVKMLNEDKELSKAINEKFTECIEQYTQCNNDEDRQSIVKQFSEWIISATNLKHQLLAFEAESQASPENYSSSDESNGNKQVNKSVLGQNAGQGNEAQKKDAVQEEDASTPRGTQAIEQSSGTPNQQDKENSGDKETESNNQNFSQTIISFLDRNAPNENIQEVFGKFLEYVEEQPWG
ncbi:hypothetical protein [Limnoraphis robusta]|uniref:G domain-containing protein n=1 Tax=Limnoraphis robusta CCNP1315 TaxID=3110306 RepID=A0ABU5U599_9CYAN|nr:hypothetical protein [Limnoraphis robusta]MEA5522339.1 hypothetical protein [Limnoraphis robusta CCNP1315]